MGIFNFTTLHMYDQADMEIGNCYMNTLDLDEDDRLNRKRMKQYESIPICEA